MEELTFCKTTFASIGLSLPSQQLNGYKELKRGRVQVWPGPVLFFSFSLSSLN